MTDIAIATAEALRDLTGYVRPDAQRRWLDANGVRYVQDRRGHPKVAADVIAKLLGVRQARRRVKSVQTRTRSRARWCWRPRARKPTSAGGRRPVWRGRIQASRDGWQ